MAATVCGRRPGGVRREVRAAVVIIAGVLALSMLGGVTWGVLAPTEQVLVVQPGRGTALTGESLHRFDGLGIFVCVGAVTGVLSTAAAWRWRGVRGPLMQAGLLLGSGAGAAAMALAGEQVAAWRHPRAHNPPVGQIIQLPPEVGSWLALLAQPLLASLVVLFLTALSVSEDLGTGFRGPFGQARSTANRSSSPATAFGPYAADGTAIPYGDYAPAGEAGLGPMPQARPTR